MMGLGLAILLLQAKDVSVQKDWKGESSRMQDVVYERVLSAEDWSKLWARHAGKDEKAPEVDFQKSMVVAIFKGNSFPKGKFGAVSVKEAKDGVTVTYGYDIPKAGFFSATGTQYLMLQLPRSASKLLIKESLTLPGSPARDKVVKEFPSAK